ncbi:MAG: hypothetical protein BWX59_02086 [Bacteroidetes bacterium ADurb.Bin028]|nr:MAG: hypothetical protein BWX59_02086 [Bacteroidetes bacterium ADurb.Bin028]
MLFIRLNTISLYQILRIMLYKLQIFGFCLLSMLLLRACGRPPCETTVIDNGVLPESALEYVPYISGKTYKFKHSNGLVVNFDASRETQKREEWSSCMRSCPYVIHYECNTTRLIPDYPIFNFELNICNLDTLNYNCNVSLGKFGFHIPTGNFDTNYYEQVDSIKIDSVYYYQVFKLKSYYDRYSSHDSIYADSMYYSYDKGIIKITLSNNEYYTLCE